MFKQPRQADIIARQKSIQMPQDGILHISFSRRNVFFNILDISKDRVLYNRSVGSYGYKHSNKTSPTAVEESTKSFIDFCHSKGLRRASIRLLGFNQFRNLVLRKLVEIRSIAYDKVEDITSMPFGGCRPRKINKRTKR